MKYKRINSQNVSAFLYFMQFPADYIFYWYPSELVMNLCYVFFTPPA